MTDDKDEDDDPAAGARGHRYPPPPPLESLGLTDPRASGRRLSGADLPALRRFRFQLFADWIFDHFPGGRVADIGGGKGMLTYLLRRRGFDAVVIDPHEQSLPEKYRDLRTGERVRIAPTESVPRIPRPFEHSMAADFDLLVALHAHGSNMLAIDAAARHERAFAILPCCVIDEPLAPPIGVNWFTWLADHAETRGFDVGYFRLGFRGQNIGMYSRR
jgi:hypothetical protein